MSLIKLKNYLINFFLILFSIALTLLIINITIIYFPSQKFFPRSLASSLPNSLITFYPNTFKKNNFENYVAILGDSYTLGSGDAYINGTYDFSIAHHLYKNSKKNYLIFGRAGYGSISAVSNLIRLKKISNLTNFTENLNKPQSIIFFFYEGNDIEDNLIEYSFLARSDENYNDFALRRINTNINLTLDDKLTSFFPLFSIMEDMYKHLNILLIKLIQDDEKTNKMSLVINRIKKLFGYTVLLDIEKKDGNRKKFSNSMKDNNHYKNIPPLQSAAASLTSEEIEIGLNIFFSSMKYIKSWSTIDNITIVYIPSPVSCYIWNEPIEYETRFNKNIKTTSNKENNLKSKFIRDEIEIFSEKNNIKFLDTTDHIKKRNKNKIIHGPLDWRHFNYNGYKMISDYIIQNL